MIKKIKVFIRNLWVTFNKEILGRNLLTYDEFFVKFYALYKGKSKKSIVGEIIDESGRINKHRPVVHKAYRKALQKTSKFDLIKALAYLKIQSLGGK